MTTSRWMLMALTASTMAACGGGGKAPKAVAKPTVKPEPPKPPPPPPVCIKHTEGTIAVLDATADDGSASFCIQDSEGGGASECFGADLATGKYDKLKDAPAAQPGALEPSTVKVETTATDVNVCTPDPAGGEDVCKALKPKLPKGATDQLVAVANATNAVIMVGQTAEVWDVAKAKKLTAIKYVKGDYSCGVPKLLGNTIFISASVCAGPSAHGALYSVKGTKIADVGGKNFGTYTEVAVQVDGSTWAFLEENGATIALQDVVKGKVSKTIDLGTLWSSVAPAAEAPVDGAEAPADEAPPAMGNPGESTMVRGGTGKLVVLSGGPTPGNIAVVDVASGEIKVTPAPVCK